MSGYRGMEFEFSVSKVEYNDRLAQTGRRTRMDDRKERYIWTCHSIPKPRQTRVRYLNLLGVYARPSLHGLQDGTTPSHMHHEVLKNRNLTTNDNPCIFRH
ncbi:hypothetical protein N656DRAFT_775969 [Canariomyces notabilis]|uniref:Uncharacterized protein n=1 Tax=Canariomyces notabilis TaxID=2074819 RepID=A0AAN6YVV2_9PEZI|nr:hypothetical protein N656DRAFT_775969 [Canariomyces arenarius]